MPDSQNVSYAHGRHVKTAHYIVRCGSIMYGPFGASDLAHEWLNLQECDRAHEVIFVGRPIMPDERYLSDEELGL